MSAQAVPAFLIGLYSYNYKTDIHPWCIATGAIVSTAYVVAFYFGYHKAAESPLGINAGITGVMVQLAVAVGLEVVRRFFGGNGSGSDNNNDNDEMTVIKGDKQGENDHLLYPYTYSSNSIRA